MPTTGSLGPKGVRVNGVALGADLDALAGERWSDAGEAETIRKPDTARPARSADRTRFDIRADGGE